MYERRVSERLRTDHSNHIPVQLWLTEATAWEALKASSQDPDPENITSNTQWSIVYNNTKKNAKIAIRRKWDQVETFDISGTLK